MSSAEAELIAASGAVAEARFFGSILEELAIPFSTELFIDSSAALGMIARQGVGRVKHLQIRYLWVQQQVREGKLCDFRFLPSSSSLVVSFRWRSL